MVRGPCGEQRAEWSRGRNEGGNMYERQGREQTSTRKALRQKSKTERRTEAQNWWKRNVETSGTGAMRCHARQRVVQGDSHRQRGNTSDPTKIHPCSTDGTQEGRDIVSARSLQRRRTVQRDRTHQGDGRGGRWQHAQVEGMRGRRVGEVLAAKSEGRMRCAHAEHARRAFTIGSERQR